MTLEQFEAYKAQLDFWRGFIAPCIGAVTGILTATIVTRLNMRHARDMEANKMQASFHHERAKTLSDLCSLVFMAEQKRQAMEANFKMLEILGTSGNANNPQLIEVANKRGVLDAELVEILFQCYSKAEEYGWLPHTGGTRHRLNDFIMGWGTKLYGERGGDSESYRVLPNLRRLVEYEKVLEVQVWKPQERRPNQEPELSWDESLALVKEKEH